LNQNLVREDYEKLIQIIEKTYPSLAALGYIIIEDPKIFLDKLGELAGFLEQNKVPYFADLGSGVIHPCFADNQKELIKKMLVYVRKLHGKVTGKFGYGIKKKNYLDNIEKKIITRLKIRYDANFKINKKVIIDRPEINENIKTEVKMDVVKSEQEKKEKKRAEENIEETKEQLDEDLQHDEEIGTENKENEMKDDLYEAK